MTAKKSPENPFLFPEMEKERAPLSPKPQSETPATEIKRGPRQELIDDECQYCQDVGPCGYCKRGRIVIGELKDQKRRNK